MYAKEDIFMSIKPEHMRNIVSRTKNHEFRKYRLPASVRRIWFYTSAPISALEYVATISSPRTPGQVPNDGGLGNTDFNAGKKASQFGYEIKALRKLRVPVSLATAKNRGYLKAAPQKYCWVGRKFLEDVELTIQELMFGGAIGEIMDDGDMQENGDERRNLSDIGAQEIAESKQYKSMSRQAGLEEYWK
jgi:hypothetical protein